MVPCAFNQPTFRPELPAHSKHRYLSRSPTRWKAEVMYTVHDQEPHMLSSDSQRLDLICFGSWLVTYAPTAAVGAASSLWSGPELSGDVFPTSQLEHSQLAGSCARTWHQLALGGSQTVQPPCTQHTMVISFKAMIIRCTGVDVLGRDAPNPSSSPNPRLW